MPRTKDTIKPETKIIKALTKNPELQQYKMPKETNLSYRTILRTLKPMENEGLIKQIRTEPSKKGGKEKKIYSLTFKGSLTYLNSITPQPKDYLVKNSYYYSPKKANEIIIKNMHPLTPDAIATSMENLGNQLNLQIFKQINWLKQHYGLDVFRAITSAAKTAINKNKAPSLNNIAKHMLATGEKTENVKLTIKDFQWLDSTFLHEAFTEAFAYELSSIKGNGDLHNNTLEQLFAELISKIEKENQRTLAPIKKLVQALK